MKGEGCFAMYMNQENGEWRTVVFLISGQVFYLLMDLALC